MIEVILQPRNTLDGPIYQGLDGAVHPRTSPTSKPTGAHRWPPSLADDDDDRLAQIRADSDASARWACKNGVFDGDALRFTPYSELACPPPPARAYVDLWYDGGDHPTAATPIFDDLVSSCSDRAWLLAALGNALSPNRAWPALRLHLFGRGLGKSVLVEWLARWFPSVGTIAPPHSASSSSSPFAFSGLVSASLIVGDDMDMVAVSHPAPSSLLPPPPSEAIRLDRPMRAAIENHSFAAPVVTTGVLAPPPQPGLLAIEFTRREIAVDPHLADRLWSEEGFALLRKCLVTYRAAVAGGRSPPPSAV